MIPGSVQDLDIDGNQLTEVGDISQLTLQQLDLRRNELQALKGEYLPASLKKLRLDGNPLRQTVNLTHLVNLTRLWVSDADCQQYKDMLPNVTVYKTNDYLCP